MAREVKFCRLQKTFQKDKKRLELNFVPGSCSGRLFFEQGRMEFLLEELGSKIEELPCQSPPGDLERSLQTWLDEQSPDDKRRKS